MPKMKTASSVSLWVVRITGLFQIVTGLLFWTGNALALIPLHMLSGLVLVIALWVLAVLAARAGAGVGLVALAAVWGIFVVVFGMTQAALLPGDLHWVIQVLHLLVGLVAMGLAQNLVARMQPAMADRSGAPSPTTA
jgi:hypothetical protein